MKLSTGKIAFPIEFDNGDKEVIYFNPNDPEFMIRMRDIDKKVQEKINGLEDIELTDDGTPAQFSKIKTFENMQNILKGEMDHAFGGSISDTVFKHCSPFAIVDGEYFVVQFIKAITPEIEKHIKKANEESYARMAKHIDKYKK